ncbi:MAG: hypothetical protein QXS68_07420 [Candidatus Methanomethylicaceae archaeon]
MVHEIEVEVKFLESKLFEKLRPHFQSRDSYKVAKACWEKD